jgi:hypothetical protein
MHHPRIVAFATTLVAVLVLAALVVSRAREVNEPGVVAYGVLLLVMAPVSAYLTSQHFGPWASQLSWPLTAPLGGAMALTVGFATIVGGCYWYWLRLITNGGSATGLGAWLLVLFLSFPVYLGCLAHLVVTARAGRQGAG